jgi:hypothetical protein
MAAGMAAATAAGMAVATAAGMVAATAAETVEATAVGMATVVAMAAGMAVAGTPPQVLLRPESGAMAVRPDRLHRAAPALQMTVETRH